SAFAQDGSLGAFTKSGDVGDPSKKGATEFNAANGQYRITGAGANIWAKQDQFQYAWKELAGNFTVTATLQFPGEAKAPCKAGIMIRQAMATEPASGGVMGHR